MQEMGVFNEMLYADDLNLMSESMEDLRRRFGLRKPSLESKGMKVNIIKTKLMVSGTKGETSRSKIDPYSKRVIVKSVLCTKCRFWVPRSSRKRKKLSVAQDQSFVCARCSSMTVGTVANKEKLCNGIETVKVFYLDYRIMLVAVLKQL